VGVSDVAYVEDIKMSYALGVTNTGVGINLVGDELTVDNTYSGFDWSNVDTDATNSVLIEKTAAGLKVTITGTDGDGNTLVSTDEYATFNETTGNYEYSGHGVSFSVSQAEYENLADGDDSITIDLTAYEKTNLGDVNGGVFSTASNYELTGLNPSGNHPTFGDITFDANALMEGAHSISVTATALDGDGVFTVKIMDDAGNALSEDVYKFDAANKPDEFVYDNHGVSFTIGGLTDAITDGLTSIRFEGAENGGGTAISYVENSVTIASGQENITFEITDQDGVNQTFDVTLAIGKQSIEDIAAAINLAASNKGFDADVATVDNGELVLSSLGTGSDAVVKVSGDGAALFGSADEKGSDSSINFTLSDGDGNVIDTKNTVNPNATSVSFSDGTNNATFSLRSRSSLDGVDVAAAYGASGFNREVIGIDVSSYDAANKAITTINNAIEMVSAERSMLGATQNRLEHTIANLGTSAENLQAAEARIRDLDMAEEIMAFTKNNILQQAATAMLAQANMAPQSVLQLLG
jgi:flagellin-like hook-associated protein FlgL